MSTHMDKELQRDAPDPRPILRHPEVAPLEYMLDHVMRCGDVILNSSLRTGGVEIRVGSRGCFHHFEGTTLLDAVRAAYVVYWKARSGR